MLKFPCLVLDHDDTVMQSEKTLCYPCFVITMARLRPGVNVTLEDYIRDCHAMGFYDMCKVKFGFTDEEMLEEYADWKAYIQTHSAEPYEGMKQIIEKQKNLGGLICVVSHSSEQIIQRDYQAHIGVMPDAIYGSDLPVDKQKPNPYPLQAIMETYQLSPADLLVLDDSRIGYDMASKLGITSAFAAWGKEGFTDVMKEMSALCDHTFMTPADFETFLFSSLDSYDIIPVENHEMR